MANTIGEKELRTEWPVVEGLTAETTKLKTTNYYLIPEEDKTISQHWGGI